MPETTVPLTLEAFRRFWFRYSEMDEARVTEYAKTDPDASTALDSANAEIAEYWPMLVEECNRND